MDRNGTLPARGATLAHHDLPPRAAPLAPALLLAMASHLPAAAALFLTLATLAACGSPGNSETPEARRSPPSPAAEGLQERLPPRGEAWVIFGSDTVQAEVARTPEAREQGLMHRQSLPPGRGMLFVFTDLEIRSFWMRNTYIPLDIAYLDQNLRIVDIQAMEPLTLELHPSAAPAMFALEVPMGWFQEKEIGVGAQARIVFGPG